MRPPTIYTDRDYTGEFNLQKAEKTLIITALERAKGQKWKAANMLEITVHQLHYKMCKHSLK